MSFHFMDFALSPLAISQVRPLPAIYLNFSGTSPEESDEAKQCLHYCEALNAGDPMIFCDGLDPLNPELSELHTYCTFNPGADVIIHAIGDAAKNLAERLEFEAFCRINSVRLHVVGATAANLLKDLLETVTDQDRGQPQQQLTSTDGSVMSSIDCAKGVQVGCGSAGHAVLGKVA